MSEKGRKMDLRSFLGGSRPRSMRFSEFIDAFMEEPLACLHTSSTLISEAIKSFGFEIVVRSGEPAVSYNVFKDPFSAGTNAVFDTDPLTIRDKLPPNVLAFYQACALRGRDLAIHARRA